MNLHATQLANKADSDAGPSGSPAPSAPVGRFTYASGAKPLQGYTIKRGIGHGGFGEVYYATSDAGKEVALKLIRRNWDVELRGVNHCLNLKHPNLLALHDVRQDANDDNWVVMELMSGESLEDVLQRLPDGLPVEEALAWMHGLAAGVAYLHDHGIVHRDLKPGNIFVDEGIIKIGDYGLSKFMSCSRRSGQTGSVGTVHYMAPEVANGRYGKEIDIYALGIILYEMLSGHVPFEGESVGEILMKHLTAEPDVSRLAEPYRTIVARALAKDPTKRFASVAEMLAMLPPAPTGAALTAAARYAGPNPAVAQRSALAGAGAAAGTGTPTGFSFWPPDANLKGETPPGSPIGVGNQPAFDQPAKANPVQPANPSLGDAIRKAAQNANAGEPIARWVQESWAELVSWWERMNFQPWQKLAILLAVFFGAFSLMGLWLPTVVVAAIVYIVYRIVRLIVTASPHDSERVRTQVAPKPPLPFTWLAPILSPALLLGALATQATTGRAQEAMMLGAFFLGVPLALMGLYTLRFNRLKTVTLLVLFSLGAAGSLAAFSIIDSRDLLRDSDSFLIMFPVGIGVAFVGYLILSMFGLQHVGIDRWFSSSPLVNDGPSLGNQTAENGVGNDRKHGFMDESRTRYRWRQHSTMAHYDPGTPRERTAKLLESLLTSAAVVAVMSLVMGMLRGSVLEISQYAWLAMTSLLGSWAVLLPAKLWEGKHVDNAVRRFVLLVLGLGVGAASFAVLQWLMVSLTFDPSIADLSKDGPARGMRSDFFGPDGTPRLIALLAYYGFVLVMMRWWKLADPLRSTRLSLWAVAVAVFWSFAINLFWPFPQPWGMMTVATIAVAVQMASPCVVKSQRASNRRGGE